MANERLPRSPPFVAKWWWTPIPDKRRGCDPLEVFIFEKMGFGAMEEYNVGAYDVATNGRLRRSHEMSAIITICKK